jgi:hypothetical protein
MREILPHKKKYAMRKMILAVCLQCGQIVRMSNANHPMIRITNELDIISPIAIKRPGLRLITHRALTDGAYVYAGTDKAMEWLKANFDCQYENGNGEWAKAA